jgi:uncharacterized protein
MKLWGWWKRKPEKLADLHPSRFVSPDALTSQPLKFSSGALEALAGRRPQPESPFRGLPTPPPGVRPDKVPASMAMDDATSITTIGGAIGAWAIQGLWGEGMVFPGYPYLAELQQRPEYRNIVETVAEEMTRKWIKIITTGDEDKTDEINDITEELRHLGVREAFRRGFELDGYMGMGILYIDLIGANKVPVSDDADELKLPLIYDESKIEKGSLRGFVPVDPTWVSPKYYNSTDPLKPDYFRPSAWYVMGKEVHTSRLLIIRSRELPDILKAAYNFGGLSLTQISKPYVDNWIRTRQSVSDLLHAFTTWVLKTNLAALAANGEAMMSRLTAFVWGRDNKGLMMVDKDTEELDNIAAPLGTLDKLQAQAQEQMAFPGQQPLLKFVGYTPTGLNPDTEDIIRTWYDRVHAKQEFHGHLVTDMLKLVQLHLTGKIDDEISYEFEPLWELDDAGKAAVEKTRADTDAIYLQDSVITNDEVRQRLAGDPHSPYHGLEGPAPEVPEPMEQFEADKTDVAEKVDRGGAEGSESGANSGV